MKKIATTIAEVRCASETVDWAGSDRFIGAGGELGSDVIRRRSNGPAVTTVDPEHNRTSRSWVI